MMRLAACLLCVAASAAAGTMEVWQTLEAPLTRLGRMSAILHTQFRTGPNLHSYHQARIGPIVRYALAPRATVVAGYYFGEAEQKSDWVNNHRLFGGIETPVRLRGRAFRLRTLAEHHFGGQSPRELRLREQIQIIKRLGGSVSAVTAAEVFFDQNGFFQQRSTAGLRIPLGRRYRVDLTYLYDARVARAAPGRHVFQAAFRPVRGDQ